MVLLILTSASLTSIDGAATAGVQAPNLTQLKFILISISISPIVIHCSTFKDQLITLVQVSALLLIVLEVLAGGLATHKPAPLMRVLSTHALCVVFLAGVGL